MIRCLLDLDPDLSVKEKIRPSGSGLLWWSVTAIVIFSLALSTIPNHSLAAGQEGALDLTFKTTSGPDNLVRSVTRQADGKILVVGDFTTYNNLSRNSLARLNANGSLDSSFNPGSGADDTVNGAAVQTDGKVLIVGSFTSYNGTARGRIARLNADGSLDSSFNLGSGADAAITSVVTQVDGKVLIAGDFTNYDGIARSRVARLNADGSLDSGFNPGSGADATVNILILQTDNKILLGGSFTSYNGTTRGKIARLNADGSLDSSFNPGTGADAAVSALTVQADGKILLGGNFTNYDGIARSRVARLNADGSLDSSFNPGSGADATVNAMAVQTDGKILLGGSFANYNGSSVGRIVRVNSDGTEDISFNAGSEADNAVHSILIQADGKILLAGNFVRYYLTNANRVALLNTNGTLDSGFNPGSGANNPVSDMAIQSDGKILIGGTFTSYDGIPRNRIARLNTDGSLDSSFNIGSGLNNVLRSIVVQSDGKILIGGDFISYNGTLQNRIARLNADGSLDSSFDPGTGADSFVTAIAIQSDGKLLIVGNFTNYNGTARGRIARLNADGSLDSSFDPGSGVGSVPGRIVIQPDGKILIGGSFAGYNGTARSRIARLNADGSLDSSFDPGTGANGTVGGIGIQSNGKIVIAGLFTRYNNTIVNGIARLNSDGSLDSSFKSGSGANIYINGLVVQNDDKILIGGPFTVYNGTLQNRIARLNADGSLDSSFNVGTGAERDVYGLAAQSDGKIIIYGLFAAVDGYPRNYLARLEALPSRKVSSVNLGSNLNPASSGQSVTFTATLNPIAASGLVTFTFNGLTTTTSPVVNGVATYLTNTLAAGFYTVTASYGGDSNHLDSISQVYTQEITSVCSSAVVTSNQDDGQATICGTLSHALASISNGTITFALTNSNVITFTGNLAPMLKAGVGIDGGATGIVLEGNGVAGNGLRLEGNNQLTRLTIRHFAGQELLALPQASPSQLYQVKVES